MSQCGKGVSIAVLFIPSINVRSGCFHVPLIFFFGGGGLRRISHCLNLIPFVTQLPYTLPRYNPWQLFLKETPHFQSAPLSLCTLRSWPLLLWGLQLWNHKMTGSFSSNTCGEIAQREVLIRWSILWGIHFSLQKRKSLPKGTFHIVNVNELVLQDVRPHFTASFLTNERNMTEQFDTRKNSAASTKNTSPN